MEYVFKKKVSLSFEETIAKVKEELSKEGFGVLTEIDVKATLKKKLNVDFRNYRILGACNPSYAYQALQTEPWIGSMLPCNLIVQEFDNHQVEVAAVNPIASMQSIENPALLPITTTIQDKLKIVITAI
ncbi:MAG: DUF302 domain-containing protein [Deltaproteobacteria bacterium]|jgi:uncharacterized protein (DUF302 family)|nr:DUF302 domain-containing protein [Deltaproteobacteria bacterium]MCW8891907.1 DUF302 domain-containing protein [Deltaproteobacteria bacterium]MCW9048731.1 DUF302 domain-containing protein [Deltaproteobacteria bacterium]